MNLTSYNNEAYQLAKVICSGNYSNVLYFEFHKHNNTEHIYYSERLDNFTNQGLKQKISTENTIEDDYNTVVNIFRNMTADFQRRPIEYLKLDENTIRDKLLAPINGALEGRAHAEPKNRKGKTDILIRSKNGTNEIIFELKIWEGPKSFKKAIMQLQSYLQPSNDYCGLLILSYVHNFSMVFNDAFKYVNEEYRSNQKTIIDKREFTFYIKQESDSSREIEVKALFVNLCL